jgi:hypothetical protein
MLFRYGLLLGFCVIQVRNSKFCFPFQEVLQALPPEFFKVVQMTNMFFYRPAIRLWLQASSSAFTRIACRRNRDPRAG